MPPAPNKRKSTKKKKKKAKPSKSSASTPEHSPPEGESDGGDVSSSASNSQHNSPVKHPETLEDNSPATKSSPTVERTEKGNSGSSSEKPQEKSLIPRSRSCKKKAVVIEPAHQEKNDSVLTKTPLVDEKILKNNHRIETGLEELVEKLVSVDEKASPKSNNCLTASTLNCPFCGRGGGSGDRVKLQHDTPECLEKHPLLSPNPQAPEKTSWKSCCGIFELCSGSSR